MYGSTTLHNMIINITAGYRIRTCGCVCGSPITHVIDSCRHPAASPAHVLVPSTGFAPARCFQRLLLRQVCLLFHQLGMSARAAQCAPPQKVSGCSVPQSRISGTVTVTLAQRRVQCVAELVPVVGIEPTSGSVSSCCHPQMTKQAQSTN